MHDKNFKLFGKPEKTILILGPCRSGTTGLLNSFAMGGTDGIYQPLKAVIRRKHYQKTHGTTKPVVVVAPEKTLVIKETYGPYFSGEVGYNPINSLVMSGIDPSTLSVIALYREPKRCLDSWFRTFRKEDINLPLFGKAYKDVQEECARAEREGINVVSVQYETLDDMTFKAMAQAIGIPFKNEMLDWTSSPHFDQGNVAYKDVFQPGQDSCTEKVKISSGFNVPPLSASTPPRINPFTAMRARIKEAEAVYNSVPSIPSQKTRISVQSDTAYLRQLIAA